MNTKTKISLIAGASIIALTAIVYFVNTHTFSFRSPINFHVPLSIAKRVYAEAETKIVEVSKPDGLPFNDNERYLCKVFGDQCKQALMIQHLENGNEACDRMHVNTNGTVDFGFMQINSVHLNDKIKLADLIDCHANVDIAYSLYKAQGWKIWVTAKQLGIK